MVRAVDHTGDPIVAETYPLFSGSPLPAPRRQIVTPELYTHCIRIAQLLPNSPERRRFYSDAARAANQLAREAIFESNSLIAVSWLRKSAGAYRRSRKYELAADSLWRAARVLALIRPGDVFTIFDLYTRSVKMYNRVDMQTKEYTVRRDAAKFFVRLTTKNANLMLRIFNLCPYVPLFQWGESLGFDIAAVVSAMELFGLNYQVMVSTYRGLYPQLDSFERFTGLFGADGYVTRADAKKYLSFWART